MVQVVVVKMAAVLQVVLLMVAVLVEGLLTIYLRRQTEHIQFIGVVFNDKTGERSSRRGVGKNLRIAATFLLPKITACSREGAPE